ncbi:hypothetical protein SLE2022_036650 [Rubroshorea leprosula]
MQSVLEHEARHQVSESGLDINRGPVMEVDDDGKPGRTGTLWTASAHIITAITGSVFCPSRGPLLRLDGSPASALS